MIKLSSQTESKPTDTFNVLEEIVRNYRFGKINITLHLLPGVFLFLSLLMITLWLGIIIKNISELEAEGFTALENLPYHVFALIQWGLIALIGFTIASMISIYKVLADSRKHIYESSVTSYYFQGGPTVEGLYQYLTNAYSRSLLPSPITGLVLCFLTTGIAYPVLLFLAEKHIRDHAAVEEFAFIKEKLTRTYSNIQVILDIILIALTLGLYLVYMGYRFSRTFNRHIDIIHSSHPNPPAYSIEYAPERSRDIGTPLMVLLIPLSVFISVFLNSIGFLVVNFFGYFYGLIFAYLALTVNNRGFGKTLILVLISLYMVGYGGFLNGFICYDNLQPLLEYYGEYLEEISSIVEESDVFFLTMYIFTNNLVLSLSSIVPYAGSVIVSMGMYNAGFALGLISRISTVNALNSLLVLVYPHAIFELLGYAILITSSGFALGNYSKFALYVLTGIVVLLLAAFIEALTILLIS